MNLLLCESKCDWSKKAVPVVSLLPSRRRRLHYDCTKSIPQTWTSSSSPNESISHDCCNTEVGTIISYVNPTRYFLLQSWYDAEKMKDLRALSFDGWGNEGIQLKAILLLIEMSWMIVGRHNRAWALQSIPHDSFGEIWKIERSKTTRIVASDI